VKQIEWTEASLEDMAALDKGVARRIQKAVERFAETGAGNVKKLKGIDPPEYRLRVGDYRVRFELDGEIIIRVFRVRNRREAYR
jgi:mRNA interferase RelE/StbE